MLPFLTTFALIAAQDTDHDGLSDDWERGVGRYEVVLGNFTWLEAKADAELRGGHLATVVSDLEWIDMKSVLGASALGKNLWLGGTDEGTEGNWRWITGEKWSYSNWRVGNPNNDSLGNGMGTPENYLMIWGHEHAASDNNQLYWNDATLTGGLLARDGYVFERGYWTDMTDPDSDDDGLADSEEVFNLPAYEIVLGVRTWPEAKADAEDRGGHLATLTSEAEWQRAQSLLGPAMLQQDIWIGGSDTAIEGQWRWITGEPFLYQRWQAGQPDNLRNQDFLMMRPPSGTWFDMGVNTVARAYLLERENVFRTDPNNPDTDGDGLKDGDEAKFYKTDPIRVDTDGDTLSDFEEIRRWKTNPLVADTDGDGLLDGDEVFTTHSDPLKQDTDGDGYSDSLEVGYGSDPNSASSVPGPQSRIYTAVEIEFDTKPTENYQIQTLSDAGVWSNFGAKIAGTGAPISRLISIRNAPKAFWRVVISK